MGWSRLAPGNHSRGTVSERPSIRWTTKAPGANSTVRARGAALIAESLSALVARPRAMAVAGALTIAFSAILVKQSGVSPSTAAIFRCAYAIPVLGALACAPRLGR